MRYIIFLSEYIFDIKIIYSNKKFLWEKMNLGEFNLCEENFI